MTRRNWTFLRRSPVPLLLSVLALALALPAGAGALGPGTGRVTGTVTLEGGGAAVGVEVCAFPDPQPGGEDEEWNCDVTGSDGTYELTGISQGEHNVQFWPYGEPAYLYQYYDGAAEYAEADPIFVTAGGLTPNVDAVLEEGATIEGTVTAAATGLPAPEVDVWAESVDGFEEQVDTDASGMYKVEGLPAGEYRVHFYPEETELDVLGQNYPAGALWEEASTFVVLPKEHVTGIDAALAPGGRILGMVRSAADGSPLSGVEVCLLEVERDRLSACLTTGASGAYEIYGLWSAHWKVVFSPALRDLYGDEFAEFVEEEETPAELAPWNDAYPTQWWKEATSSATATPIAETAPATISGIDASLGTPPALVQPGPSPAATLAPPVIPAQAKAKPKVRKAKRPVKCKRGFGKRKLHGKERCVRHRKVVRHAKGKHRKHAA